MGFEFSVLSSGSRANSLFFTDGETRLLVDCGLSARETANRLSALGVEPESINAIVVTHEHSDHVKGVRVFAKKYRPTVFSNARTAHAWAENESGLAFQVSEFETGVRFALGQIEIEPFSVSHDAADPVMLRLTAGGKTLGIVTDLGQLTNLVREKVRELDALIVESNHDPLLLQETDYPWHLKQRIRGRSGHLCNDEAAELVREISAESLRMQVLIGGHISENSNHPTLALETLERGWVEGGASYRPEIAVASAFESTRMFSIR